MKLIALVCFLLCINFLKAQDQLFKVDNSKLEVKIIEITPNEIKYKLFTYQDGPTIIIAKSDVALIIYQNGVHEVITKPVEQSQTNNTNTQNNFPTYEERRLERQKKEDKEFEELTSTKNLVGLNVMEILNGGVGITYLREFNSYLNVYVPLTIGATDPFLNQLSYELVGGGNYSFKYTKKTYEVGLGINLQTSGKKKVTHFIGPYVSYAQLVGNYDINYSVYNNQTGNYTYINEQNDFTMKRINFMLNNGVLMRPTKNFNIMLNLAVGYRKDEFTKNDPNVILNNNINNNYYQPVNTTLKGFPINAFKFGVTFGYRF